jgi:hypothetical protein
MSLGCSEPLLPRFLAEGKSYLTHCRRLHGRPTSLGLRCRAAWPKWLKDRGFTAGITHRDVHRKR